MASVRPSTVITGSGAALTAFSVLMAFLADHHWLIGYDAMLLFERSLPWVQLAGLLLLVPGSICVAVDQTPRLDVRLGIALTATALILPLLFGGYSHILNVHNWTFALAFPLLTLAISGVLLAIIGFVRHP